MGHFRQQWQPIYYVMWVWQQGISILRGSTTDHVIIITSFQIVHGVHVNIQDAIKTDLYKCLDLKKNVIQM